MNNETSPECDPASPTQRPYRARLLPGLFVLLALNLASWPALAVPSFARQTGLQCAACHTSFPQLTPFGRDFKLHGYTMSNDQSDMPPLAVMLQPSFTHTSAGQPGGAADGFGENNNWALTQASLFYAGRILGPYAKDLLGEDLGALADKIGVFLQGSYDGVEDSWSWDNFEVRYADTGTVWNTPVDYGLYLNNNPTMQDLWNTTPAWGYPYTGSGLAPTPAAATLIGETVAQQAFGVGGYARFDGNLYVDVGGYHTLGAGVQKTLGVDPAGEPEISGMAPYWRVAFEHAWGNSHLELGTYGMAAHTYPGRDETAGTDHFLDLGVDTQYQYLNDVNQFTAMLNWTHERQTWDASTLLGGASNVHDNLWNLAATAAYQYDATFGGTVQYFTISGDRDLMLYPDSRTGSPDSDGWTFQLDYMPFNKNGGPGFWTASSVKFSLQYTLYNTFDGASHNYDGAGRDASDNDTLYLEAWTVF